MKSFFNTTPLSFDELFELEKNIYDDQIIPKDQFSRAFPYYLLR